jgi:hypothetical protein
MNFKSFAIAGSIFFMSACASVSAKSVDYPSFAGAAIPEVRFQSGLYNWQRIDDGSLVVWTRPTEAYLLSLRNSNCSALRTAKAVVISDMDGTNGRMIAGSTDVVAGIMRCRIETIQPIDQQRLKADQK